MKLTESYLRGLIKQALNEMTDDFSAMQQPSMSEINTQQIDQQLLSSLEEQGYEVREIGNGNYEIMHPTDPLKSYILEPKISG